MPSRNPELVTRGRSNTRITITSAAFALAIAGCARPQPVTVPAAVTGPEVAVQRFVDAANARDADAMAALVSPDAVFARFPGGQVVVQSRDSIRAFYTRSLASVQKDFRITVAPRTVEGQIVIDQEHFVGLPSGRKQATWIYLVRDGLIHRAWVVDGTSP